MITPPENRVVPSALLKVAAPRTTRGQNALWRQVGACPSALLCCDAQVRRVYIRSSPACAIALRKDRVWPAGRGRAEEPLREDRKLARDHVYRRGGCSRVRHDLGNATVESGENSPTGNSQSEQVRVGHLLVPHQLRRSTCVEETIDTSSDENWCPGRATIRSSSRMASMGERASGTTLELEETRTNPLCVTGQVAHFRLVL